MSSSRQVRAGDPLPKAPPAAVCTPPSERHPFKEIGAGAVVAQESRPPLPWEDEAMILEHEEKVKKYQSILAAYLKDKYKILSTKAVDKGDSSCIGEANLEHEEKVNKYEAMLAARLKDKYFSRKAFDKGDVLEEITIQSETIQISRWPLTSLFADPAKFCQEKKYTEKNM